MIKFPFTNGIILDFVLQRVSRGISWQNQITRTMEIKRISEVCQKRDDISVVNDLILLLFLNS